MTAEEHLRLLMRVNADHMADAAKRAKKAAVQHGYLSVKLTTTWERAVRREPTPAEIETLAATHGDDVVEERWPGTVRMISQREAYRRRHPRQQEAA